MDICVVGVDFDGLSVVDQCLLTPAKTAKGISEVIVDISVVGVDFDCLFVAGH